MEEIIINQEVINNLVQELKLQEQQIKEVLNMLKNGAYAYSLKQRILSDYGHLSNENAGRFLSACADSRLKYVFLGHLSKDNNTPKVAFNTVRDIVTDSGIELGGDFNMWVAAPYGVKRRIEL